MKFKEKALRFIAFVLAIKSPYIIQNHDEKLNKVLNNSAETFDQVLSKIKTKSSAGSDNCTGGGDGFN